MVLFAPSLPTSKVTQQQAQANNVWLESGSYGIDLVMRAAWQVNAQSILFSVPLDFYSSVVRACRERKYNPLSVRSLSLYSPIFKSFDSF
jgi:hypothetical protein